MSYVTYNDKSNAIYYIKYISGIFCVVMFCGEMYCGRFVQEGRLCTYTGIKFQLLLIFCLK